MIELLEDQMKRANIMDDKYRMSAQGWLDAIEDAGMLPPNQLNGCVNNIRCEWEEE